MKLTKIIILSSNMIPSVFLCRFSRCIFIRSNDWDYLQNIEYRCCLSLSKSENFVLIISKLDDGLIIQVFGLSLSSTFSDSKILLSIKASSASDSFAIKFNELHHPDRRLFHEPIGYTPSFHCVLHYC